MSSAPITMPLFGQSIRSLSRVVSTVIVSPQLTWSALASSPVTARTPATVAARTTVADSHSRRRRWGPEVMAPRANLVRPRSKSRTADVLTFSCDIARAVLLGGGSAALHAKRCFYMPEPCVVARSDTWPDSLSLPPTDCRASAPEDLNADYHFSAKAIPASREPSRRVGVLRIRPGSASASPPGTSLDRPSRRSRRGRHGCGRSPTRSLVPRRVSRRACSWSMHGRYAAWRAIHERRQGARPVASPAAHRA